MAVVQNNRHQSGRRGTYREHCQHLDTQGWAIFSDDDQYRYELGRQWGPRRGDTLVWIMLNPSSAGAYHVDPTISRCSGFAHRWRFNSMVVLNLFALVQTDREKMKAHPHPEGINNLDHIAGVIAELHDRQKRLDRPWLMFAWGNDGQHRGQQYKVAEMLFERFYGLEPYCLKMSKKGCPVHPLYQSYEQELQRVYFSKLIRVARER